MHRISIIFRESIPVRIFFGVFPPTLKTHDKSATHLSYVLAIHARELYFRSYLYAYWTDFFLPVREILFSRFIFTLASGRVHIYNSVKASTFVRACAYANVAFGLKISHPLSPYGEIGFSADSLAVGQENKKKSKIICKSVLYLEKKNFFLSLF